MERILAKAGDSLAALLRASLITDRSPNDLTELKIEDVDFEKGIALLPEKSINGRRIKDRVIWLTPEFADYVRQTMGPKKSGWLFARQQGDRWNPPMVGRLFRMARKEAGVPDEVVVSGRGGVFYGDGDSDA